ncbi:MAG TPA: hypothetical protein PKW90_17650, partial [Myxococcota bacterium]|nr:hypothetical protein [Myxococcota bacterium]
MAKSTLKLVGVYEPWGPWARQGRLVRANGTEVGVLVRVLEETADGEPFARLREDARLLGRLQHENALRLENVSAVGGKMALVHEGFEGVSAAVITRALGQKKQVWPARAAVELAAQVGLALEEALRIQDGPKRLVHPGPSPDWILVDATGKIKLAGLMVLHPDLEAPPVPSGYRSPEGGLGLAGAAYMVGALLIELLGGEAPPDAASESGPHEAVIRRAVIRVLARPGEAPGDATVQILRQALAFDPNTRGTPGALGRRLRELAVALQSPGLRTWAPSAIPDILASESRPALPNTTDQSEVFVLPAAKPAGRSDPLPEAASQVFQRGKGALDEVATP